MLQRQNTNKFQKIRTVTTLKATQWRICSIVVGLLERTGNVADRRTSDVTFTPPSANFSSKTLSDTSAGGTPLSSLETKAPFSFTRKTTRSDIINRNVANNLIFETIQYSLVLQITALFIEKPKQQGISNV